MLDYPVRKSFKIDQKTSTSEQKLDCLINKERFECMMDGVSKNKVTLVEFHSIICTVSYANPSKVFTNELKFKYKLWTCVQKSQNYLADLVKNLKTYRTVELLSKS